MKIIPSIILFTLLSLANIINAQKPNIWIHTDMTAAYNYSKTSSVAKAETDQSSDPDDHVALAMYLMQAYKFNTVGIVMGVTNRNTTMNVLTFFNETFRTAYASDVECLNKTIGGYPAAQDLPAYESSTTAGNSKILFDDSPVNKYDNYNALLGTVKLLVDELKSDKYSYTNPLYVLEWGGLTEIAMVVRHLQRNNETEALKRLFVVSHWHTSYSNTQSANGCYTGSDAEKYGCANCNVNCQSCKFMRDEAIKTDALFRWVDVASVGQTGIVNGSGGYFSGGIDGSTYKQFEKSRLGELFVKSKFSSGKPDGSDCGSFYAVLGEYGVTLASYSDNGQTTAAQESNAKNKFSSRAHDMLDELLNISNIASGDCSTGGANNLKATVVNNAVNLQWDAVQDQELSYFVVYKGVSSIDMQQVKDSVYSTVWVDENVSMGSSYFYQVELVYKDGTKIMSGEVIQVNIPSEGGADLLIPGKIEAELYSDSLDINTQATQDVGGGKNVGWINNGDWAEYQINVSSADNYEVLARVASGSNGGVITFMVDGTEKGAVTINGTGGWQSWASVSTNLFLPEGKHVLRTVFTGSGTYLFNVNWYAFSSATANKKVCVDDSSVAQVYFNTGCNELYINLLDDLVNAKVTIVDSNSRVCKALSLHNKTSSLDVASLTRGWFIAIVENNGKVSRHPFIQ